MKRAVIDLGTNSTLLLIGELDEDYHIKSVLQEFYVTRLGENLSQSEIISKKSIERTITVLNRYAEIINRYGVDQVHIVGTHALRITRNAMEFKNVIQEEFNWRVEILSPEQEAMYSYIGACDVISPGKRKVVVIDIGGGSTEVILGEQDRIIDYQSLPIGVVTLAEKLGMKEKLSQKERKYLYNLALDIFSKLSFLKKTTDHIFLVGVGGTITTLAAVKQKMKQYQPEKINGYLLTRHTIHSLYNTLNILTLQQRREIAGISPGREDVIIYGILLFAAFMELFQFNKIVVSDRGLRFGYLKWVEMNR
jgi:exopolyphosphatase/guanosine-5'-triphosphate,3'-diphosphate pyrophosphatase